MKKGKNDLIQLAILVVLGASVVLSLALPQLASDRQEPRLLSLSVLFRDSDSTQWTNARLGMEQAADELGAELRFLTLSTPDDSLEQENLLLREAEGGADALVVVPADPLALAELALPCPFVTLESPAEGSAGDFSPDNALLGRELAQALLEDWTGGSVLLLDTAGPRTGITLRLEAAREELECSGVSVEVRTQSDSDLPSLLDETGAGAVMVFEPSATLRAAEALEERGLSQRLYGVGSTAAITARLERGSISAVAAWSDYAAGYLAVGRAVEAARGRSGHGAPAPLAFSIIRGEDIYEPDNQKLLFPVTS